jgi:hypothetical protein
VTVYERVDPVHCGADGTDIIEFYREGTTPETAWPVAEVKKYPLYMRSGRTGDIIGAFTERWGVTMDRESAVMFATKGEALAYARKRLCEVYELA